MYTTASVNYHVKQDEPQAFYFDVDGIAGKLLSPELVSTQVNVQDLRSKPSPVNFDDDGIRFTHAPTAIHQFEHSQNWQQAYNQEISDLLQQTIGAKNVIVFDHTLRIDDNTALRKPARNVHNDYSQASAKQRLIDLVGDTTAATYEAGHYGFVNLWRPVEFTVTSSPLGFIRPQSTQPEDWMGIDLIYPDRQGEILGVAANAKHEWFYQSEMTPEEVTIFNIYDNRGRPFLAHSALDIVGQAPSRHPRKSLETRTLVRYA